MFRSSSDFSFTAVAVVAFVVSVELVKKFGQGYWPVGFIGIARQQIRFFLNIPDHLGAFVIDHYSRKLSSCNQKVLNPSFSLMKIST